VTSSPPCITPGWLLVGGEAAKVNGGGTTRVSVVAHRGLGAARARVRGPKGCGGSLNRPGGRLGVRATHGEACARPARARSRTRARVWLGQGAGLGMTSGPRLSATAGAGGEAERAGGGAMAGWWAAVLGCCAGLLLGWLLRRAEKGKDLG
jgi:hypothetical protein